MELFFLFIVVLFLIYLTIWNQASFFGVSITDFLKYLNLNPSDWFYNLTNLLFLFAFYSVIVSVIYCYLFK